MRFARVALLRKRPKLLNTRWYHVLTGPKHNLGQSSNAKLELLFYGASDNTSHLQQEPIVNNSRAKYSSKAFSKKFTLPFLFYFAVIFELRTVISRIQNLSITQTIQSSADLHNRHCKYHWITIEIANFALALYYHYLDYKVKSCIMWKKGLSNVNWLRMSFKIGRQAQVGEGFMRTLALWGN